MESFIQPLSSLDEPSNTQLLNVNQQVPLIRNKRKSYSKSSIRRLYISHSITEENKEEYSENEAEPNNKKMNASLPFRIVENREFVDLVHELDNNYSIPKRKNLSGKILNEEFDRTVIRIKSCLAKASSISITLDIWTSIQNYPYMGVTCHCLDERMILSSYTLAVRHLPGTHSSEAIKENLIMVLNEYNIFDKIVGIVTDNCSNMINLSSLLNSDVHPEPRTSFSQMQKKVNQFSCCAHVLNLILQRMSKYSNEKLSGCKYVTISIVIPTFGCLQASLLVDPNDSLIVRVLKKLLNYWTKMYTDKYGIFTNKILIAATFLDVRTKLFGKYPDKIRKAFLKEAKNTIKNIISNKNN
ncbi:zinc finger BED domain-containing 1-like [Brachionus plicatilis]|uniref:Zinc finger BED domain-containing 1-like n=1 Tax=Brachionus plicatilis TaxID=10195 RepID=A0A3M7QT87_BRAPC|nr:zinc finger BED domain-containing 1-like [Brachionus plicatilis]